MITARAAFDILKKKYPAKKCTVGVKHKGHYIFVLLEPEELKTGAIDCLYSVDAETGELGKYTLSGDEESFYEDLERAPIKFEEMVDVEY